jgi:hypothetical protein
VNWLHENWGNLASLIGLAISVTAYVKARTASIAVRAARQRDRVLLVVLQVERSLQHARGLQATAAKRWPLGRCDALRECICEFQHAESLSASERRRLRTAIAELRLPRENDQEARVWVRELVELLISARNRLLAQFQELDQ